MICVMTVASTAVGSGFGPNKRLRFAPTGYETGVYNIAARGDNIAVGWRETRNGQYFSVMRYSTNGGRTFTPMIELGEDDPSTGVVVDVCGSLIVALTGPGHDLDLDIRSLDGTLHDRRDFVDTATSANGPYMACVGDRRVAAIWYDVSSSPARLKVAFEPLLEPMADYLYDLGPIVPFYQLSIAATESMAYATWMRDGQLRLKRFSIAGNNNATVNAFPAVIPFDASGAGNPVVAADGTRVVLAYSHESDLRLRISDDYGATFGPAQILVDESGLDSLVAGPNSVDVRGPKILVEASQRDTNLAEGDPNAWDAWGLYSNNDGVDWAATPTHGGGLQVGAIFFKHGQAKVAEAWDPRYHGPGGTTTLAHEWIKFHAGTP